MADFLVEVYTPKLDAAELAKLVSRLAATAEAVSVDGARVRYVRAIHVPEDETCFHLFEAQSAELVWEAGRCAGLTFDRVTGAVDAVTTEGGTR